MQEKRQEEEIQLTHEQAQQLVEISARVGNPWQKLLVEFIESYRIRLSVSTSIAWLQRMAELEDSCPSVVAGGMAAELDMLESAKLESP